MKLVLLTLVFLLRVPNLFGIDMLDCALGRLADQLCPEDGGWSHWSSWGECEGECGAVGRQTRFRNCSNPRPERNGADCDGDWLEIKPCSVAGCSYEQYEKLLAQDEVRLEQLANLRKYSGSQSALLTKCLLSSCKLSEVVEALPTEQTKFWNALVCVKKNTGCPVAGGWGDWSPWTRCNAKCGLGQQVRCRACCDPPPSSQDVTCRGDTCEFQECTGVECGRPLSKGGEWANWSSWSDCSSPCNFGYMRRTRVCKEESKTSSNREKAALNNMCEYDYDNYANNDEDSDFECYINNNDGEISGDDYMDDNEDPDNIPIRAKRSSTCEKVEYYYNDNEEDLLSKNNKTTIKSERYKVDGLKTIVKTTVSAPEPDSGGFQKMEDETSNTSTKSTPSFSLEFRSKVFTPSNYNSNKPSNDIRVKIVTTMPPLKITESISTTNLVTDDSNEMESLPSRQYKTTTKCNQILNTKKKENRVIDPILLDNQEGECSGSLYKNFLTDSPCNKKEKDRQSEPLEEDNKNSKTKYSISTVSQNAQESKTLKPDVINSGTSESSEVVETILDQPSSIGLSRITPNSVKSDNIKITTKLDVNNSKSKTEETVVDSELNFTRGLGNETSWIEMSSSTPVSVSREKQSLSTDSTTGKLIASADTTPVKKLFGIFPKKISTLTVLQGTTEEIQTFQTTSSLPEIEEVPQQLELNVSEFRPISCDLSKKLQLPSFSDLFPAEGCSGSFEEIKPCNTQLCNEDGGWSEWSSWTACSPDCGLGWQLSVRSCTNPEPRSKGSQCQGEATRHQSCYLQPCPVILRTTKAVFMTGESMVKYEALQQHFSLLMLYVRLRHLSPTGSVVSRKPHDCANNCDHLTLSLYRSHVLVSVLQQKCHTDFLTSHRLSIGEWHELLLTIVGSIVTLRVDDSVLTQKFNLSCRPSSPNYDGDMKVGGSRFVGEIDRLIVNFKNYNFEKKREKRDSWTLNDDMISPSESSQVQYEVNSKDILSASLSHFLQAPCFLNPSSWNIDFAIKPKFPDGLVLFIKGYDSHDFLFVSLEQTRIRLRVRAAGQAGECELAETVAPLTWLHLGLSRPAGGTTGLSVNRGPRCVVSLAPPTTEEPAVYCTGGILLGEMPLSVKAVLTSETSHVEPLHSPSGLLGHLSVDNHTLNLARLPHKTAPDFFTSHSDYEYQLSSHTAASTVYYEEMLVLEGESLSMPCIYDLSPENKSDPSSIRDLDNNWYKLDLPIKTIFSNESGVRYDISATGKAVTLNITGYPSTAAVEGFYSCWLLYPLPLQSGLNIVTYGVIIVSTSQDKSSWLFWLMTAHVYLVVILLVLLVIWLVYEAYQDYKLGSGYFRCKQLKGNDAYEAAQRFILSDEAISRLGGVEAAEEALERYNEYLKQTLPEEIETETESETYYSTDNQESSEEV